MSEDQERCPSCGALNRYYHGSLQDPASYQCTYCGLYWDEVGGGLLEDLATSYKISASPTCNERLPTVGPTIGTPHRT